MLYLNQDEIALPIINKDGMPIANPKLRDYENVPLKEDINRFI